MEEAGTFKHGRSDPLPQMLAPERLIGDDKVPFHGHLLTLSGILLRCVRSRTGVQIHLKRLNFEHKLTTKHRNDNRADRTQLTAGWTGVDPAPFCDISA
jgi:hypothetical protein